jgi:hypothetical protein
MKKLLIIPVLISILAFPAAGVLLAASCGDNVCEPPETPATCAIDCQAPNLGVFTVLNKIIDYLFTALLIFAAIMIMVAAYYFVTAAGNPETVAKARHFVIYALIGVVVALLARGLVVFIQQLTRF